MNHYKPSKDEIEFLKNYNISNFERPSLAVDIVVFSLMNEGVRLSKRHPQRRTLKVLLVRRGTFPYKGKWALPGGFCIPGENVIDTARRELKEETNVDDAYLSIIGAYGEKGRDPRGWIISNTFLALINGEDYTLHSGTDAWEARWFSVDINAQPVTSPPDKAEDILKMKYTLTFHNEEANVSMEAVIMEEKVFHNQHEAVSHEIYESPEIAFDHAKILLQAFMLLKERAEDNPKLIFDLLPEAFTLTQLQNAFEIVLQRELLPANFRRKIAPYVVETEEVITGEGFRPAKLYKRNIVHFIG